ncbi:MAG: molybdopterin-guanine dinucleotide biosynthesis protein B [Deltaproteobacteria bacterium]|nr:molybdopterin-guanine dinucleotide biosynthesis protein B [Deltaproteobacteria bacterium]
MPPIVCIVGKSDSGKTTLLEKLIPALVRLGLKIGTVKHDVHGFEMDHPGKDSYRHKQAGAATTIISSPAKMAMVKDVDHDQTLSELAGYFHDVDLILSEGYKRESHPKVEIFRPEVHPEPLCRDDDQLIALVTDTDLDLGVPRFGLEAADALARFLVARFVPGKAQPQRL